MLARLVHSTVDVCALVSSRFVHVPAANPLIQRLPIVGEVPAAAVAAGQPFWRQTEGQQAAPKQYQHAAFPDHYDHLPVLYAAFRDGQEFAPEGTWASRRVRRTGLTPGLLSSLPFSQQPRKLVFPTAQISTALRHFGASWTNRLSLVHIVNIDALQFFNRPAAAAQAAAEQHGLPQPLHTFQVLPRRISTTPVHNDLLAVTLMNCPSSRIVTCNVPIVPINAEEAPSSKRGAFPLVTTKQVRVRSLATNIPLEIRIDCSEMEIGDRVFTSDLALPQGQVLIGLKEDLCLIKMDIGG